ncbi:uncharacterized protein BDZ99DRAFT_466610 [Mytilinidion resinicola]|uniref:Uncharacterized protein n=1 Tax=Mytilinidion resinicola TaxID=574789 RepID=A0A6A6YA16_9PEZI|nr:uncharacterized protein BDZ99DRAFT_466610 [Mytilinidion resinicola]KAF2805661.1 hypothetical protein BDZ99DRAFT_466610 [Mytilinidion resinicola]
MQSFPALQQFYAVVPPSLHQSNPRPHELTPGGSNLNPLTYQTTPLPHRVLF